MAWRGRYLLLVFDCLLVVGIYFCTDIPSALQTQIEGSPKENCTEASTNTSCCLDCLGLGADRYNLLYTIYSWTSSIIVLPVGYAIDRMGNRVSALIFTGVASSGSLLFAVGSLPSIRGTSSMFPIMMIGRLLLGAGTGSSRIVRDRVIACWFPDKLGVAFGIAVSTMGIGSVLTFLLTANLAEWIGLGPTLFVGAAVCSTCFLSAIGVCVLDWYGSKQPHSNVITLDEKTGSHLSAILKFPLSFWTICIMTATYYSFQLTFTANGSKLLQEKFSYTKTKSSYTNGVVYDVSVILSPFVGIILTKVGHRGWFAFLGAFLSIAIGPVLLYTDIPPLISYIWFGIMFTITVVSLWSSIPHIVPPMSLGIANGIASFMLDLSVGLTSLAVGQVMSSNTQSVDGTTSDVGWRNVFIILFGHVIVCAIAGVLLNTCCKEDGKVNATSRLRRQHSFGPVHCSPIPTPTHLPEADSNNGGAFSVWPELKHTSKDVIIENEAEHDWKRFSRYKATMPKRKDSKNYLTFTKDVHIELENNNAIDITIILTDGHNGVVNNRHNNKRSDDDNHDSNIDEELDEGAKNKLAIENVSDRE